MLTDFRPPMGGADAQSHHDLSTAGLSGAIAPSTRLVGNEPTLAGHSAWANGTSIKANSPSARDRVLTYEEQFRLEGAAWECHFPVVAEAIALMLETAMRPGELKDARWSDVDWEARWLTLKDGRRVPLTRRALIALAGLGEQCVPQPNPFIVPLNYSALVREFRRVCQRADVSDLRLNDLRHTALTRIATLCGDWTVVGMMAGFRTISPLKRYMHLVRYEFDMSTGFDAELFEATVGCWRRVTDVARAQ